MKPRSLLPALLAAFAPAAAAAPHGQHGSPFSGLNLTQPLPANSSHQSGGDTYVVIFDADLDLPPQVDEVLDRLELTAAHDDVLYTFNNSAFRGFTAKMQSHCVDALNGMVDVSVVETAATIDSYESRGDAPWGLQRISSSGPVSGDPESLGFTYTFEDNNLGSGVDLYVLDTGVNTEHALFGGRATKGFSAYPTDDDGDGHGTHCAGTAAGSVVGVSSGANIIGVKVLGDDGSGDVSFALAGMDWVVDQHNQRKNEPDFKGSVISMSFGIQGNSAAMRQAVTQVSDAGVHIAVAAGNDDADACDFSPSELGGSNSAVVSVGSVGFQDGVSDFSNTGSCVDIFAPGEHVLSTWVGGDNVVNFLQGTSMATPHVSGVMVYMIGEDPASFGTNPQALKTALLDEALGGVVQGSRLLNNGETGRGIGGVLPGGRKTKRSIHVVPEEDYHAFEERDASNVEAGDLIFKLARRDERSSRLRY